MTKKLTPYEAIEICEGLQNPNSDSYVEAMQALIDNGMVWHLQGCYQRNARALINKGLCHLKKGDIEAPPYMQAVKVSKHPAKTLLSFYTQG